MGEAPALSARVCSTIVHFWVEGASRTVTWERGQCRARRVALCFYKNKFLDIKTVRLEQKAEDRPQERKVINQVEGLEHSSIPDLKNIHTCLPMLLYISEGAIEDTIIIYTYKQ